MLNYYEQRQREYEAIYVKPERQIGLAKLESQLIAFVSGCRVLEIACGTGYWTRRMAPVVATIHATDASGKLASAAMASCSVSNVSCGTLDAYSIPPGPEFNCLVAGFFLSHIPIKKRQQFFGGIAQALRPGSRVVFFDNRFVKGSSTLICRRTAKGDTFQTRTLSNGARYEVLKNFPSAEELRTELSAVCASVSVQESQYFWLASGVLGG